MSEITIDRYACEGCGYDIGSGGTLTEPVAAIFIGTADEKRVRFAHRRCAQRFVDLLPDRGSSIQNLMTIETSGYVSECLTRHHGQLVERGLRLKGR